MLANYIPARLANAPPTGTPDPQSPPWNAESAGPLDRGISTCYARHMETALLAVSAISALAALVGAVSGVWAAITSSRNSKSITHLTGRVDHLTGRVDHLTDHVDHLNGRVEHLTGRVDALQVIFAATLEPSPRS